MKQKSLEHEAPTTPSNIHASRQATPRADRDYWQERKTEAKKQGRMLLRIEVESGKGGAGIITCKEMKAEFPSRNVTRDVAILVTEALDLLEMNYEPKYTNAKTAEANKVAQTNTSKPRNWTGNTICEATAMEPRNVRSGYLGWEM